jgi:hypothetical protein
MVRTLTISAPASAWSVVVVAASVLRMLKTSTRAPRKMFRVSILSVASL